jgi:hypothetical protein
MGKEQTNNAPVFDHANRMEDVRAMTKTSIHFSILLSASYSFRYAFDAYSCAGA